MDFGCYDTVIDCRSPAEYAEDHIPGAISAPVLDDSERATVGTHGIVIRPAELAMLLDGIDLNGIKRRKRYQRPQTAPTT